MKYLLIVLSTMLTLSSAILLKTRRSRGGHSDPEVDITLEKDGDQLSYDQSLTLNVANGRLHGAVLKRNETEQTTKITYDCENLTHKPIQIKFIGANAHENIFYCTGNPGEEVKGKKNIAVALPSEDLPIKKIKISDKY